MGKYIFSLILCILLTLTTAQDPLRYGEPDCFLVLDEAGETWISAASTPYFVSYTCGLDVDHAVTNPDGSVTLSIDSTGCPDDCSGFSYACGEVISANHTKFGTYTCNMKAQGVAGTIQTCQATTTTRTPFEMIYFAFIGNVTDAVFVGFFVNGMFQSYGMHYLPFDGAADFHNYTFTWSSSIISWFVDGDYITEAQEALLPNNEWPQWPDRFLQNFLVDDETGDAVNDWHFFNTNGYPVDRSWNGTEGISVEINGRLFVPEVGWACNGTEAYNPGGTPQVNDSIVLCSMADILNIFDDSFNKSWNYDFSTNVDIVDVRKVPSAQIHSGYVSIEWTLFPLPSPSNLLFNTPAEGINTTDYYGIEFWLNGGSTGNQQILAYLYVTEVETSSGVDLSQFIVTGIQQSTWTHIVIPFLAFGSIDPNATTIYGIYLTAGNAYGGTVYIDDVYLIQQYPICPNDTLVIFDDNFNKAFNNYSAAGDNLFNNKATKEVHNGSYSLSWLMAPNTYMKFQYAKGNLPSTYTALSFWVYTKEMTGSGISAVSVYMTTTNSGFGSDTSTPGAAGAGAINLVNYYGGIFPGYPDWIQIVIPFYEFGITSTTPLLAVEFYNNVQSYAGVIYIDDLEFIAEVKATAASKNGAYLLSPSSSLFFLVVSVLMSVMYMM